MQQPARDQWARSLEGAVVAGRYRLERLLGMGGMGAVFAAVHVAIERRVAVKLLAPETVESREVLERFQQEARAAAALERRGVVEVLDFGVDPARGAYLVMEYLRGESLAARLKREAPLDPRVAARLVAQVLETLAAVHRRGIVHRDIKPGNLFVARAEEGSGEEFVKVLDFGISRVAPPPGRAALTAPGTVLGTPRYMAPEQAMGAPDVDARADLYSVGAVLYTALGGKKPYSECRAEEVLVAMCTRGPLPLRTVRPGLRESLCMVVDRAMARDRRERFQAADEMLAALREAVPEADLSWPATRPSAASQPPPRPHGTVPSLANVPRAPWLDPNAGGLAPGPRSVPPPRPSHAPGPPGLVPTPGGHGSTLAYGATLPGAASAMLPPAARAPGRGGHVWAALAGALVATLGVGGAAAWWRWSATPPAAQSTPGGSTAGGSTAGAGLSGLFSHAPEENPALRGYRARMEAAEAQAARGDAAGAQAALRALRNEMDLWAGARDAAFVRVYGRAVIDLTSLRQAELGAAAQLAPNEAHRRATQVMAALSSEYSGVVMSASRASAWDVMQCATVALGRACENFEQLLGAIEQRGPVTDVPAAFLAQERGMYVNLAAQNYRAAATLPGEHDPRCEGEMRAGLLRAQARGAP